MLDTNVLIYAISQNSLYTERSSDIIKNPYHKLFITTKVISEFFAVGSKLKIQAEALFLMYYEVLEDATVLFPEQTSLMHFETLLKKYPPKGNRVFDLEIASVMLANDIKTLATFNTSDFKDIQEIVLLQTKE